MNSFPEWILVDGKRIAFDPEGIYRSIFAALDDLGDPNSFLARELTDAVLYHVSSQLSPTPTSRELNELVNRVLAELGYSEIVSGVQEWQEQPVAPSIVAQNHETINGVDRFLHAIQEKVPPQLLQQIALADRLREISTSEVYSRDLLSAAEDGLLRLTDLDTPLELMGWVWNGIRSRKTTELGILDAIWEARSHTSCYLAFDQPEKLLLNHPKPLEKVVDDFTQELRFGLQATNLRAFINLNLFTEPIAKEGSENALFSEAILDQQECSSITFELLARLMAEPNITILFHLSEDDLIPGKDTRLNRLISSVSHCPQLELVFDRPRRPIILGPGLDRQHQAVISCVGMNLLRLMEQIGWDQSNPQEFLKKVGSLTRLARSVGYCRRAFLRKHARSSASSGFLLERSRLLLSIDGLWEAAEFLVGASSSSPGRVGSGAEKILKIVQEAYGLDSSRYLSVVIDTIPFGILHRSLQLPESIQNEVSFEQAIELVSGLHRIAGAGLWIANSGNPPQSTTAMARMIRTFLQTEIRRFKFNQS
jgi:hypothetical protein